MSCDTQVTKKTLCRLPISVTPEDKKEALRQRMAIRQTEYWDKQYNSHPDDIGVDSQTFDDWLISAEDVLASGILELINKTDRIHMVGIGRSRLAFMMYDLGYTNIICSDISSVLINEVKVEQAEIRPGLRFEVVDVTDMNSILSNSCDVVFDKCTSDTLQFRSKTKDAYVLIKKMLSEVHRTLDENGRLFVITPRPRMKIFDEYKDFSTWSPRMTLNRLEGDDLLVPQNSNGKMKTGTKHRDCVYCHTFIKLSKDSDDMSNHIHGVV